ncbi:MAG: FAD-dependent oxidoreductase [Ruminococcaceae bacterium]|nr:FAD-dependent oxidoreductase [Oscillospiraceae bacterium]
MYDIAVIGAGPAGLTAALYALRADKSVIVLEKAAFGGQITFSPKLENYPGTGTLSGNEFAEKLVEQVLDQGADIEPENVLSVLKNEKIFVVKTEDSEYEAKSVIVATGARHRMLGLENEENLVGNGISFCAVCDGAFYKDKCVAVIGGGNSALQEALLLSTLCQKVYVVQNLSYLTGEERLAKELESKDNVEIILSNVVSTFNGEDELQSICIKNTESGEEKVLSLDGVFIAIGLIPQNEAFAEFIDLDSYGYADSGEDCTTRTEGIFVAGDCRKKKIRQVATAVGDGAVAALAACNYIDENFKN